MAKIRLKYPFSWEERQPYLADQALFVPQYYFEHHQYEMASFTEIFGNSNPIYLEICSGNGDWILQRAKENPDQNWIAVEKDFQRIQKIYSKKKQAKIENLLIVSGEAEAFIQHYLQPGCIEKTYINFPDPWPKERHAKHRLIKSVFIRDLAQKMKEGATLTFVSDDYPYIHDTQLQLENSDEWNEVKLSVLPKATSYGSSWFEELWREKGKTIYRIEASSKHA